MTDKKQDTTPRDPDAKAASSDAMLAAMENCGCDCASMMARFFQGHPGGGTADEKDAGKGCR